MKKLAFVYLGILLISLIAFVPSGYATRISKIGINVEPSDTYIYKLVEKLDDDFPSPYQFSAVKLNYHYQNNTDVDDLIEKIHNDVDSWEHRPFSSQTKYKLIVSCDFVSAHRRKMTTDERNYFYHWLGYNLSAHASNILCFLGENEPEAKDDCPTCGYDRAGHKTAYGTYSQMISYLGDLRAKWHDYSNIPFSWVAVTRGDHNATHVWNTNQWWFSAVSKTTYWNNIQSYQDVMVMLAYTYDENYGVQEFADKSYTYSKGCYVGEHHSANSAHILNDLLDDSNIDYVFWFELWGEDYVNTVHCGTANRYHKMNFGFNTQSKLSKSCAQYTYFRNDEADFYKSFSPTKSINHDYDHEFYAYLNIGNINATISQDINVRFGCFSDYGIYGVGFKISISGGSMSIYPRYMYPSPDGSYQIQQNYVSASPLNENQWYKLRIYHWSNGTVDCYVDSTRVARYTDGKDSSDSDWSASECHFAYKGSNAIGCKIYIDQISMKQGSSDYKWIEDFNSDPHSSYSESKQSNRPNDCVYCYDDYCGSAYILEAMPKWVMDTSLN